MPSLPTQSGRLPTPEESAAKAADRFRRLLAARKASGPSCEWCEATAQEYEFEYHVDHDASSDLLRGADEQRTSCRAGFHATEQRFARQFRRPGNFVPRPQWRCG